MLREKEHYDLMAHFERVFRGEGRLDREPPEMWPKGYIYQDATINRLFLAYRKGYAYGKAIHQEGPQC